MKKSDVQSFDQSSEFSIVERSLPHWIQAGTICFITWRLADSLPKDVLIQLDAVIAQILRNENLPFDGDWKTELAKRPTVARGKVYWKLFTTREKYLDAGYGKCLLRNPVNRREVLSSLQYFDEDRYFITDAIIMPNHIHFLCAFANDTMLQQCENWKRYTARLNNKNENRRGGLWQVDQFDHLIRSDAQFEYYRAYIEDNPVKASLNSTQFTHFKKTLKRS